VIAARRSLAWFAPLLFGVLACDATADEDAVAPLQAPSVDALLVAGDSLYWLWSDSSGLRLRGVAMTIAHFDGAFHEIYSAEEDRSFYDAIFVGQSVYRRDLERGDSLRVLADTLIPRLATAYAASHPRERPLRPDEPANEHARTIATAEFDRFALFGHFLSLEYRAEVDVVGGMSVRETRRAVVDLRTGSGATVTTLFGTATAQLLLGTAREDLAAAGDPGAWRLDPASFSLDGTTDTVLVTFEALATDPSYGEVTLSLTPIAVPAPAWWTAIASERPVSIDPTLRFVNAGVQLVLAALGDDGRAPLALIDSTGRRWDAGRISGTVRQVLWLDSTVTPTARTALRRAFDDAALYSGEARVVRGPSPRPTLRTTLVALLPSSGPRR
jgi:hypothetical protein